MKLLIRSIKPYLGAFWLAIFLKFLGTASELLLPYILEHMVDHVVPSKNLTMVIAWGLLMFVAAVLCRTFNVQANRRAIFNAHNVSYDVRQALFEKTANLSGKQFDGFGLPSLISRMTSDSYNVQQAVQQFQTLCVRAPIMLVGGVFFTLSMDWKLSLILILMIPFLLAVVLYVSSHGIPLFTKVQQRLDTVVRIMRENITGIRVVKALSKSDYEIRRFGEANDQMMKSDIHASQIMAIPWPFMQMSLNIGLVLVIIIGARRVNAGEMQPGVILAFLTYFNMITMGVMGLNRIFMSLSRASASANRIDLVLQTEIDQTILSEDEVEKPSGDEFIRFEHVTFTYDAPEEEEQAAEFAGGEREMALTDVSFEIRKGESLGIIGPTGCGKTTVINLLMRFYDVDPKTGCSGAVYVDGRDVRTYDRDELRRKFGVVFQNDTIFQDTLRENINFGRGLSEEQIRQAVEDAMAAEYIDGLDDGLEHEAAIKGANLSGGQKQRLLVARALANDPEILILDDSSSALDYKTDASMRKAINAHHQDSTTIMIAQRVSSIMNMTKILVMDNGRVIGYGTHQELLESCPDYRSIYEIQMESGLAASQTEGSKTVEKGGQN
ncbi:MAG: ABC transporter ATP-binding protein [Firmicutes bacterium]|nr:ABC transporter ATP-binding protein [Bacillota bacterium]